MPYDLLKYFEKRIHPQSQNNKTGPFVTISRQAGCGGTALAAELVGMLGRHQAGWRYINKEVLVESARKLKLEASKIKYVFDTAEKNHIDEILFAMSTRHYKSDRMVRKTITAVLRHFAQDGKVVIVGRAGIAATRDLPNGLHIRLTAPEEWRIQQIMESMQLSKNDAAEFLHEEDAKRSKLIEDFSGKPIHELMFDLSFNRAAFTHYQLAEIIVQSMKFKGLIV